LTHNASKVDQLWSLLPVVYAWHFHYHDLLLHPTSTNYRSLYVCLLITLWGARLTFNFWRKGGLVNASILVDSRFVLFFSISLFSLSYLFNSYGNLIQHEEDYRWPILRKKMNNNYFVFWILFNFSFIAVYQVFLFFLSLLLSVH
jgi:steroid 5-alpha reductase family enzyme